MSQNITMLHGRMPGKPTNHARFISLDIMYEDGRLLTTPCLKLMDGLILAPAYAVIRKR